MGELPVCQSAIPDGPVRPSRLHLLPRRQEILPLVPWHGDTARVAFGSHRQIGAPMTADGYYVRAVAFSPDGLAEAQITLFGAALAADDAAPVAAHIGDSWCSCMSDAGHRP